jgi:site-specific recombinase XerD
MKLAQVVDDYIRLKQSLGFRFEADEARLKSFSKKMGDVDIAEVDAGMVMASLTGPAPGANFKHRKLSLLRGLYRFAIGRGYATLSPLPTIVPKQLDAFIPYIYTDDELRRLLSAIENLTNQRRKLPAPFLRPILLLLYGAGLRLGESLALTFSDIDLAAGVLTVRDGKFHKTRLVPVGPKLLGELQTHAIRRRRLPLLQGNGSAFFSMRKGMRITNNCMEANFRRLCALAGIRRNGGTRVQPRLHDLRHSFAVHRLVSWYRSGSNVQRLLPLLSTYLGHVNIAATQRYLTMTPELLQEANHRFERYALSGGNHV